MPEEFVLGDFTVAYVMIKTELGAAEEVASSLAGLDGVRWAVEVTGPYDVIAGVRVSDNQALGDLVVQQIHTIPGVTTSLTSVMTAYYRGGERQLRGTNGPP